MQDQIVQAISKATGINPEDIHLEIPGNPDHGDLSTNIALIKAKTEAKPPKEIAKELKNKLSKDINLKKNISKIEIAGPGFINFHLSQSYLTQSLESVLKQKNSYGSSNLGKGTKILFEFGQPNTHKLPHIGHLFSYIYGQSVANILEFAEYKVKRANYQGDIGLHVAKCLWAYISDDPLTPKTAKGKVQLLQKLYQKGSKAYEENKKAQDEIVDLNIKVNKQDPDIAKLWKTTRQWSIDYYKNFETQLGIHYDKYYFESEVYIKGSKLVRQNLGKIFKKSQGAIIFEGSKYGLHDRVFITKHGNPTYEAKDLALQLIKVKDFNPDKTIITTAKEQNDYFKVVFKALEKLDKSFAGKLSHIGFGMVNLKSGKMSSRTGNIINAVDLVNLTIDKVKKLQKNEDLDVSNPVGIGAVKYSFLKTNHLQDISFDVNESIAKVGNSGPYIQYTYARTQSVLAKAKLQATEHNIKLSHKPNPHELALLRTFTQFQGVIIDASNSYSPNLICNYLHSLAQQYNSFYNSNKIIGSDNVETRLAITTATGQILKNGLTLLGIVAPQRM